MKKKFRLILPLIISLVVLFLTIGYSVFIAEFSVSNIVAKIREEKVVRITGVTTQSGIVSNLDYSSGAVVNDVQLASGASITYNVTVTNLGNVPIAVSNVTFTSTSGQVTGLSSNIDEQNYVKICDNGVCTGAVSKNINVIITNNNSASVSGYLGVNLKFSKVYSVTYSGSTAEVLEGRNYTITFSNNAPSAVIIEGTYDSYTYQNNVLTINNINSNITVYPAYNIYYNGEYFDKVKAGNNYSYTFETEIPKTIAVSGTCASSSYSNFTISLTNVQSDITLTPTFGKIEITNIQYISSENVASHDPPSFNDMTAEFNIKFMKGENSTTDNFNIVYEVTLLNDYVKDYIFRGFDFNPIIHSAASSDTAILHLDLDGVVNGDVVPVGTSKTFRIILWLEVSNPYGSYTADVGTDINTTETIEEEVGNLTATVSPSSGDLSGANDSVQLTVTVSNTYPSDKTFNMILSNSNLKLVNQNNQSLSSFTVSGSSTEQFTVYVSKQNGAAFLDTSTTTELVISPNGLANVSAGSVTFAVDKFEGVDNDKVIVSNASISMYRSSASSPPTAGRIDASWQRVDEGGTPIKDYVVTLYNSAGSTAATYHTNSGATSCSFTGLSNGSYYIIVYGIDGNDNSGADFAASATTGSGYATRSATSSFTWTYTVNLSGMSYFTITQGDVSEVNAETTYTLRFSAPSNYKVPTNLDITMGNRTLTINDDYTYTTTSSSTNATLQIPNVTGNLVISGTPVSSSSSGSGSSGCLVAGTQVTLADGSTKKIEDLEYNDLLMVVDHLTGELSVAYPVWIEKENASDSYLEITFDDGTVLKAATSGHSVFDADLLRYKDVADDDFGVGNRVYKLDPNTNKFKTITVTGKEIVKEDVTYHNVITVGYYNFIAENLLTQESFSNATNLYGFKKNLKYSYGYYLVKLLPKLPYSYFIGTVPHHIFIGSKLENAYTMIGPNFDEDFLRTFAFAEIKEPYKINGNNAWMMTTSLDDLSDDYHKYLYEEGSTYTLPNNKEVKCFFNTYNDKCYKPGSKVIVETSFHFIAKYK